MAFSVLHYCNKSVVFNIEVVLEVIKQLIVFHAFNANAV